MAYAIVHKGRVIVGPLAWAQKYFTDVLKIRHRITASIPGKAPDELPYVIDENTKIHAVEENKPEVDLMTQYHYGPLWDLTGDVAIASYEVREQAIEDARNNFRALAAHERYKKEVAGTKVTIQDTEVSVDTTREGRAAIIQKHTLLVDGETANWKFPEGWLTLTKLDLAAVVTAADAYVQGVFDWEKSINDQIDAATTAEELHAIEIETTQAVA